VDRGVELFPAQRLLQGLAGHSPRASAHTKTSEPLAPPLLAPGTGTPEKTLFPASSGCVLLEPEFPYLPVTKLVVLTSAGRASIFPYIRGTRCPVPRLSSGDTCPWLAAAVPGIAPALELPRLKTGRHGVPYARRGGEDEAASEGHAGPAVSCPSLHLLLLLMLPQGSRMTSLMTSSQFLATSGLASIPPL